MNFPQRHPLHVGFTQPSGTDPAVAEADVLLVVDADVPWYPSLVGPPADAAYSRHALHHLPDLWKAVALRRMAAMLRPGGMLHLRDIVFACEPDEFPQVAESWLATASADAAHGWTRPELETHLREEHSTFAWLLEPMLRHAGFDIVAVQYDPTRVYAAYAARKRDEPAP